MSQGPWGSGQGGAVPPRSYGDLWYLQGEGEALGPYNGNDIRAMIAAGSVGPASLVAQVGATQWSAVADVPAFAASLPAAGRVPVGFRYAGFWIRVLAAIIDWVLLNILVFAAASLVGFVAGIAAGSLGGGSSPEFAALLQAIGVLVGVGIALFYYIYFSAGRWQATPGKRICGIHLVRADGGRITRPLALGRYLSYFVSAVALGIGFLMVGWTDQKKGLHDIICGTRVIHGKL